MARALRALRRRRSNQKGFTLIEMLVVISILGILAAVVTMSMVGVVNLAQSRADSAEMKTVQVALDTMANEQQLDASAVCTTTLSTNDMSQFPDKAAPYNPASPQPPGTQIALYPRYIRSPKLTHKNYQCSSTGVVSVGP